MTDKELFIEIFNRIVKNSNIAMKGTLVYYKGICEFNTDGYNLAYNLFQLTSLLNRVGEFR